MHFFQEVDSKRKTEPQKLLIQVVFLMYSGTALNGVWWGLEENQAGRVRMA